ncbi:MAG: sodium:solute symporter family protein [Pirellulaceae bacterium]|nr:sodium:solute symporter family protein [Pirellulaceae bacterium]
MLAFIVVVYFIIMYGISYLAQRRISSSEEFLLAGRRLPLSLAWMTLLATWFGAGTLLAVSDEVRATGIRAAALDPLGAGCCLLFVAAFVAAPIWRMKISTVPDFFRIKYGRQAELISACILVPSYFGWIAAQFTALAAVLHLYWQIPVSYGLPLVAILGTGYTLMGGMWSVTWTDAVQVTLLLIGLVVLAAVVLWELGSGSWSGGLERIISGTPAEKLVLLPTENLRELLGWLDLFMIGALGNVAGQDLMQRVFASNSPRTASWACGIAGTSYLAFGSIPVFLAIASAHLLPNHASDSILPMLVQMCFHPAVAIIFMLALLSAILSTIDSAILSPASILTMNFVRSNDAQRLLSWNRLAVVGVSLCSLVVAYAGENAYKLLEESYAVTLVGLLVPLLFGLWVTRPSSVAGITSMIVGSGVWLQHYLCGWSYFLEAWLAEWHMPVAMMATLLAAIAYIVVALSSRQTAAG